MNHKNFILYIIGLYCVYSLSLKLIDFWNINNKFVAKAQTNVVKDFNMLNIDFSHYNMQNINLLDANHNCITIKEILKNSDKDKLLLFVFNESDCKVCIDYFLKELKKKFNKNDLIVITNIQDVRGLKFYKQNFDVPFDFYKKQNEKIFPSIDSLRTPVLAIIDNNCITDYVFHPQNENEKELYKFIQLYKRILIY